MRPETPDDFEVAIICALSREADAVLGLFDQIYDEHGDRYGKQKEDMNAYSTGRIGQHHIVLAHMPRMGTTSAASVATGLRLSFKRIRLALVVGVCGAAPLGRPIILGDVIISDSIVEFDFGKRYPDRFERKRGLKDTLGSPNTEIKALLSKLETRSVRQRMEKTILQNLARLQEKGDAARYPGAEHDRLFAASYRHMHQDTSSHGCRACVYARSTNDLVCDEALESDCGTLGCNGLVVLENSARGARLTSENPAPLVHIGTIGSANMVMKSGEHRDAIARDNNIIAFEMEGAGVWDILPCLVIKGVCDYADSHKNKIWQDYAAATAASAAKAFLAHWTSGQHNIILGGSSRKRRLSPSSEDDLNASVGARRTPRSKEQNAMASAQPMTDHTGTGSRPPSTSVDSDARKVRLEALNFEQLDARQATIKTAHAATCQWLLSKSEYLDWQSEDKTPEHHGFLWIKGKPGAGKSTIMNFAYISARKNSGDSVVISYFFNARGESLEKSTIGMYRSLLFQLLSAVPRLKEVLDTSKAVDLQAVSPDSWTVEILQLLFHRAIEKLKNQRLTCFVDALDECENSEDQVREMVRFFETLGKYAITEKIPFFVCFSSRHYPHITIDKCVWLILEAQQGHAADIRRYINSELKVECNQGTNKIKSEMFEKAQGVFLWVVLVVPMLQKAYDHGQVHALSECLKGIPKGLDELFEDLLKRDAENMGHLRSCLKWILYADRPLSPEELYLAILSASNSARITTLNPKIVTTADINRFILSSSKGLAETTKGRNPTIQFIHESVRDFLLKQSGSALQADIGLASAGLVHDFLKHCCQRYLVNIPTNFIQGYCRENVMTFPLLEYSIHNVFAETAASLGVSQEKFLKDFPLSHWILSHDSTEQYSTRCYSGTSLMYILIEKNFLHLFQVEICQSQSINARGGRYDFPIFAAVIVGNEQILGTLLRYGADHTKTCKQYRHALHAAIDKLNAPAVAILMANGAVPAANISVPKDLIEKVVKKREIAIMKLLLENSPVLALPLSETKFLKLLARITIQNGDQRMLRLFLESGVISKVNHPQLAYALYMASANGDSAIVRMLIDFGADVNVACDEGTALGAASNHGGQNMVRFLINSGADVNASHATCFHTSTALYIASGADEQAIVRILLEHGADVHKECPLFAASSRGHGIITQILLEGGADPNQGKYYTLTDMLFLPLHETLKRGDLNISRLLLDYGADVNISSSQHKNAFSALDSCPDHEKRTWCEQLLCERDILRPSPT